MIWSHIFSKGLKYATEKKKQMLEKSPYKTLKTTKNEDNLSSCEL